MKHHNFVKFYVSCKIVCYGKKKKETGKLNFLLHLSNPWFHYRDILGKFVLYAFGVNWENKWFLFRNSTLSIVMIYFCYIEVKMNVTKWCYGCFNWTQEVKVDTRIKPSPWQPLCANKKCPRVISIRKLLLQNQTKIRS